MSDRDRDLLDLGGLFWTAFLALVVMVLMAPWPGQW